MTVSVVALHDEHSTPDVLRVGDVYRIGAATTAEEVAVRRERAARGRA